MQNTFSFLFTFLVMAFGSVPNCGASCGRSTGLFMSEGTDSVLRILATAAKEVDIFNIKHVFKTQRLCSLTADQDKTYLVEKRFCKMELPLYICCGTLICRERAAYERLCSN